MSACTAEPAVPPIGAVLAAPSAKLPLPIPKPKLPGGPILLQLCAGSSDLAVQPQTVSITTYGSIHAAGWAYVCTPVKSVGGVAWSSAANQVGIEVSNSLGGSVSLGGFSTLAVGSSMTRCGWVKAPGLTRVGHHTPEFGECKAEFTLTSALTFDPDILLDGNTANDDCLSKNNQRTTTVNYMQSCPW